MEDDPHNSPAIKDISARAKRFMKPSGWNRFPGWDNPSYDRMAEQVLGVMSSVGEPNTAEGIAVLTKVLAMLYVKHAEDPTSEQIAEDMQRWTENLIIEVVNFDKVVTKHKAKMRALHA